MSKADRGFASMDKKKQQEIASKGGKGTAHEWSAEEARQAGRKGGTETGRRKAVAAGKATATPKADVAVSSDDHEVSRFADEGNPHN
jgi:general stress protein YciG